jgi:hypothetical protein
MGATARIRAGRTALSAGLGHISIHCFVLGRGEFLGTLFHAAAIFSLAMLPYLVWRLRRDVLA